MKDELENFKITYGFRDCDVTFFSYGSRVYGTATDKSDYDFLAVVPANYKQITGEEFRYHDVNIHCYNEIDWQNQLHKHKIHCLEAYYLPDGICKKKFTFKLDKARLRCELSEKASHSFVKAKKKIDVEKDYYTGWKSLFHSLRILNFGIQIATLGEIKDYSAANSYWNDIIGDAHYEWQFYKTMYQPIYNELSSKFKKVAPK